MWRILVSVFRILLLIAAVVAAVLWAPDWSGPVLTFSYIGYNLLKRALRAWFPEQAARLVRYRDRAVAELPWRRRRRRNAQWGGPGDHLL